jgi:cytoskeletal protein CcmA (bactofilin family)
MKGNIKSSEKVSIFGKLIGNIDAGEVYLDSEAVLGDVQSAGDVETLEGSVLVGDVNCNNITISGALKGNIEARDTVVLRPQAVVEGDISAERIEMSGGAVLNGRTTIRSAVSTSGLFDIEEE